APTISEVTATATATTAVIQWITDEPAAGEADYGPTTAYGQTATSSGTGLSHHVALAGLEPETTYHYRIRATDPSGNAAHPVTGTFTTAEAPAEGDVIDVWYGPDQSFGTPAHTQTWVNIMGSVPDDVTSLSYRVNGGPSRALAVGPDNRRLENPGDFNVDI